MAEVQADALVHTTPPEADADAGGMGANDARYSSEMLAGGGGATSHSTSNVVSFEFFSSTKMRDTCREETTKKKNSVKLGTTFRVEQRSSELVF